MTETQMGLARFENWRRWASKGKYAMLRELWYPPRAAVVGQHLAEAGEVWGDDYDVGLPIDEIDAELVGRLIKSLPAHMCNAVRFKYTERPQHIGIPDSVIDCLVEQAARAIMQHGKRFHVVP
jgi:hypothetical protein